MARSVVLVALVLLAAVGCSKQNDVEATSNVCGDNTLDCIPCASGEYRCDGATLKVCQLDGQGFDAVSVCVSQALCVKGLPSQACAAPVCDAADTKCEGAIMWVCSPQQDEYVDTECPSVDSCTAGLSIARCAAGECAGPTDCTGVDTDCRKRTCEAGTCGFENVAPGEPCETNRVCDGSGNCAGQCNVPADCSGEDTECRKRACETGVCDFQNEPEGTSCETNRFCDGAGKCIGQCNVPADCGGQDTECRKRTCEVGVCGVEDQSAGTPVTQQNTGDCKKWICDGMGGLTSQADVTDAPNDNNPCTKDNCSGSTPTYTWSSPGTPCNGSGVCDGAGVCSVCVPGQRRCQDSATLEVCVGGTWASEPCVGLTDRCDGGSCVGGSVLKWVPAPTGGTYGIDKTEVARSQYEAWLATNPVTSGQPVYCSWNIDFAPDATCLEGYYACKSDCTDHPQICVDWCDAYGYCRSVGKRLCGRIGGQSTSWAGFADPSESQWYNACSSGGVNTFPYGYGGYSPDLCNGGNEIGETVEVGSLAACESSVPGYSGVYDMSGNVWEWEDCCEGTGPSDDCRIRGGGFRSDFYDGLPCDSHYNGSRDANLSPEIGFRCCSDP